MTDEQTPDLETAVRAVLATLSSDEQAELRAVPERLVESRWFWLWGGRGALCSELSGQEEGSATAILKATWNHLNGHPLAHQLRFFERTYSCPSCRKQAVGRAWDVAELERVMLEPCDRPDCAEVGAEIDARMAKEARLVAEAKARFTNARALGLAFQAAHRSEPRGRDAEALVALARLRFEADPEFQALWCAVYPGRPSASHAEWLRLWTLGD